MTDPIEQGPQPTRRWRATVRSSTAGRGDHSGGAATPLRPGGSEAEVSEVPEVSINAW